MNRIRPRPKSTPFNLIIANCALVLVLSSALPLLSKILGKKIFQYRKYISGVQVKKELRQALGISLTKTKCKKEGLYLTATYILNVT